MSWLTLKRAAKMLDSQLIGDDAGFERVSIDTRNDSENTLFFSLKGPNFDAHEILDDEPNLSFSGIVVSRAVKHSAPTILVEDTRQALGQFASEWRSEYTGKMIGLTGSNGKTTVKQMLAEIFSQVGDTLSTAGNLNNDIGVPLTLLNLRKEHRFAVVEMGANHAGEIAYLTQLVRPEIALITNAGPAHLEGFGSVAGVAKAKAEIFDGLVADGIAVINADDRYADDWLTQNQARTCITFGVTQGADVQVINQQPLRLLIDQETYEVPLKLIGQHNALNAAAAAAVAIAAQISVADIVAGLSKVTAVKGRLELKRGPAGSALIDDTYNANPGSVDAAIIVLSKMSGSRYLVLGDLAELGAAANDAHAQIGLDA
ncbi:MAG TPA: UDP-N-acetylmuramoyl-tripeptide--D-alanyl-D-alanine ligase, partial [Gammaproteobacteria bacterium]|nr:UDP-N-acetylmuramoyl-tripeptide--D-alanyl-D-alanine ligase [Gammaproteobacteria bacterium]